MQLMKNKNCIKTELKHEIKETTMAKTKEALLYKDKQEMELHVRTSRRNSSKTMYKDDIETLAGITCTK